MPASRPAARLARLAAACLIALATLGAPAGVLAKCVLPVPGQAPWAGADAVFVGTVTGVANGDRWATVLVEEVWLGPDQPAEVVVRGGPEDAVTSVDRAYVAGMRYVFGVMVENGTLLDNACSGTTPADSIDLAAMRPAEIRQPGAGAPISSSIGIDLSGLAGPLAVLAVVGGLLIATVFLTRRREA
jgi:hypothetical protein